MMTTKTTRVSMAMIREVEDCLSLDRMRNVPSVRAELKQRGIVRTDRAVRYAMEWLIRYGRARRVGRPGQRWWAFAVKENSQHPVDTQIRI